MRMPRAVATFNRRFTNPAARSIAPWLPLLGTLEHVGRKSGKTYRTPLLIFKTKDGFVVLIGYGPESDWVKNVFAGGPTALLKMGQIVALGSPQIVGKADAAQLISPASRLFYHLFPYDDAALILRKAGEALTEQPPKG